MVWIMGTMARRRVRGMGRAMALAAAVFLVVPGAAGDDLEDGLAAYDRGDYRGALEAGRWRTATWRR